MLRRYLSGLAVSAITCALTTNVYAATVYEESVSGDLSNSGLTPTLVTVLLGANQILGVTGVSTTGIDRDYFTITVPAGLQLSGIAVLPGTTVGTAVSFLGVQAGNQVTVPTDAGTASGLLGWTHYSGPTADILDDMGIGGSGASGFVPPLPAGSYAFWVQEFDFGLVDYGFDLQISAVPEPAEHLIILAGLGLLALALRRRSG